MSAKQETVGLDRVVFFGDAVVAIAITLLALPLVDVAARVTSAAEFLDEASFQLVAAAIGFASIAGSWRANHRLFRDVVGYTPAVVTIELAWLASIMALPIATELIVVSKSDDRLALGIFLGVITLTAGLAQLQREVLLRSGNLRRRSLGALEHVDGWLPIGLRLIALVVCVSVPELRLWPLCLLLIGTIFSVVTRRRRYQADAGALT